MTTHGTRTHRRSRPLPQARCNQPVTRLLHEGTRSEVELLGLVYDELQAIAARHMSGERHDHTLQATALVHEAYIRLTGSERLDWRDRKHFYGAAAEAMRRVLIDHARRSKSQKRGGDWRSVTLGAQEMQMDVDAERALAVYDALDRLAREDERAAEVARLRFLVGLSVEETADTLGVSERSVHREWAFARARMTELLAD